MTVRLWPNKRTRDEFFDELRALIEKHSYLGDHQARVYADDPTNSAYESVEDYPDYDPKSPVYLQGVVVILTFANMEHYEDIAILEPYNQSQHLTDGLIERAGFIYRTGTD